MSLEDNVLSRTCRVSFDKWLKMNSKFACKIKIIHHCSNHIMKLVQNSESRSLNANKIPSLKKLFYDSY